MLPDILLKLAHFLRHVTITACYLIFSINWLTDLATCCLIFSLNWLTLMACCLIFSINWLTFYGILLNFFGSIGSPLTACCQQDGLIIVIFSVMLSSLFTACCLNRVICDLCRRWQITAGYRNKN